MSYLNEKAPKIAVVGDVILDKYSYGEVCRISPEAPVPILSIKKEVYKPGGAGNVAANLARLGAEVHLFSVIGADENRKILKDCLEKFEIKTFLFTDGSCPTILKQRCLSKGHQLLRIDYESVNQIGQEQIKQLEKNFAEYDAVIVSDYAKGVICSEIMEIVKKAGAPIFVDPKPVNKELYKGAFFITPNILECTQLVNEEEDLKAASRLRRELNTNVLLKRSEKGLALFEKDGNELLLPAEGKYLVDVTGAGDTVIATLAFFYTKGLSIEECVRLANKAAGISISRMGCYQVNLKELI